MPHHPSATRSTPLPPQAFFAWPGQRVSLACERFSGEGQRPTGLVNEHVIQSWTRGLGAGLLDLPVGARPFGFDQAALAELLARSASDEARTARRLGVSRGLLYRRLREWHSGAVNPAASSTRADRP